MQGGYVSRRVRRQTPLRENARASSFRQEEQASGQTVFLCATARCHPAALRFSPGDRRRPEILGRAQRAVARPRGEGLRGARGRPPHGVRRFRRQYPGRQLRRGQRDAVGPGHVRPAGRCRGRGATGARRSEVPPARRETEWRFRHRSDEGPRQGQRVAAPQEAGRVRRRGLGRGGARLQRALRPHPGRDRAQPAGAQDQTRNGGRGRSRLGHQSAGQARAHARREDASRPVRSCAGRAQTAAVKKKAKKHRPGEA